MSEKTLSDIVEKGGNDADGPRLIVVGDHKAGKSTLASAAPAPLFIGNDDGWRRLQVTGVKPPETWPEFMEQLSMVEGHAKAMGTRTVVVDTLNGVTNLCAEWVCREHFGGLWSDQRRGFMAWGGSGGWSAVAEEEKAMRMLLDSISKQGLWVILLAHQQAVKINSPTEGDYTKWSAAMDRRCWEPWAQWADGILRIDLQATFTEDSGGRRRAVDTGQRILRASSSLGDCAGMRAGFELPPEIPLDWQTIEGHLGQRDANAVERLRELWSLMDTEEADKAEHFLGVAAGELESAPTHKVRQLVARLTEREEKETS
jgi:hypothetical protein